MPIVSNADHLGAVGVTIVQLIVERELGWIFRRIDHRDTGLDAEVEVVIDNVATGLLIGLQIKTGLSYFKKRSKRGWLYRGDRAHLRYWRQHRLATLIVLVDPNKERAFWSHVGGHVKVTGSSWTLQVPEANELGKCSLDDWFSHAWAASPREALLKYCDAHRQYLELLSAGGRVIVEADEWVNKTRGQASFRLLLIDSEGKNVGKRDFIFFSGISSPHRYIKKIFPWASVDIDESYYDIHEDVPIEAVFHDSEDGYHVVHGERPKGMRPYSNSQGEIDHYRLELFLNKIGRAYCELARESVAIRRPPPAYSIVSDDDE